MWASCGQCRITFTITCDGSLSYAEDSYNDGCDFAFSITEYGRMRLTRKEGQQVEVEGLLTQLSIGMTVFITADGEGPVTVKELNVRKWTSGRRFLDEIEKVEDGEAKAEGSPAGPDGALMKDSPVQQLLQAR